MAEQFPYGRRVELVDPFEFLGMDAAGHKQAIDPEALGAGQIRPHGIPDRQHAVEFDRMAAALRGQRDGALVDRSVRLAVDSQWLGAGRWPGDVGDDVFTTSARASARGADGRTIP